MFKGQVMARKLIDTIAYKQGRLSCESGNSSACNPYSIDTPSGKYGNSYDQWLNGWMDAKYGN
jgi:hypothetical protein